jgi:hypothetical protein
MLFGGVSHEWAGGTPSFGVVPLFDSLVEGSEELEADWLVELVHVDVVAESVLVGEFDPTAERPSVLHMGAGGNGVFSVPRGSIEETQEMVSGLTGQILKSFGSCSGQ